MTEEERLAKGREYLARLNAFEALKEKQAAKPDEEKCGKRLDCGGVCFLDKGHEPPCLCVGDEAFEPNSCPA